MPKIKFDRTAQVILGISFFFLFATFIFGRKAFRAGRLSSSALSSEIEREDAKAELYKKIAVLTEDMAEEGRNFTTFKDAAWLVGEITKLADKADISINYIEPLKARQAGFIRISSVKITGKASFHKLGYFLSLLESAPYYIVLDQINMVRSGDNDQGGVAGGGEALGRRGAAILGDERPSLPGKPGLSAKESNNPVNLTISCLFVD